MNQAMTLDTSKMMEARQQILANYYNVDAVVDRLEMFLAGSILNPRMNNVIFYGKGGYGKSEMTSEYIELATGVKPFVVNINQSTAPADLFGGMNLPDLQNGNLSYNIQNSFMAHPIVIFEEGLEARPKVLSALKHVITSGQFTLPGMAQPYKIKTIGIIIVTNVDTAEFNDSDDTKAFIERFPIQYKVGWEGLNQSQRLQASLKVVNKFDPNYHITDSHRRLIAENLTVRLESPRQISKVVMNLLTKQAMAGGGTVEDDTFQFIMNMMGYADKNLAAKIEEERIKVEIQDAKSQFEALFEQLTKNMAHYNNIKAHINDPAHMKKLAGQIEATERLIGDIQASVAEIRTNPNYGNKGNELASWINTRVGEFSDQLEEIKRTSYSGLLLAFIRLLDKMEKAGIDLKL